MRLKKLYEIIVEEGMSADPRDKKVVLESIKKTKEAYQRSDPKDKEYFDKWSLGNPYDDTRILNGDLDAEIKTALVGIDIDTSELLLIDRLNSKNKEKIDLAISHHPQGSAFAALGAVMQMQADIFYDLGVPINVSEKLVDEREKEISRRIHAANHYRVPDAARLLGIPLLCMHTPADNHAVAYLEELLLQKKPQDLKGIMDMLMGIEEYKISSRQSVKPTILFGSPSSRPGKIFVDMTGGTEGPKEIFDNLLSAGVGTIVGMHLSEEHYKKLHGKNINVIIAGHIASDNLGMNLLLDKIQDKGKIKILACSGFRRIKRS
jgi:hypothetical protein